MKLQIKLFCHSIVSDWNHGNAHFLRGVVTELVARGHDVEALEPEGAWSVANLIRSHGPSAIEEFHTRYPSIRSRTYDADGWNVEELVQDADLVLVHEWNASPLIAALGNYRKKRNSLRLFFHDTHHRAVTAPGELVLENLEFYDALLVYGSALKETYTRNGWSDGVFVWHEAADTRVFKPMAAVEPRRDLVWIGNWGDEERTQELEVFLIGPAERLGLRSEAYGVRYPEEAIVRLERAGFAFSGWLPNYAVPEVFARHRVTVHVPRRPYLTALPGIPTIRPFEAMACGIPLICARWRDTEGLFREGKDYLVAQTGAEAEHALREVLNDASLARQLAASGLETIENRHTCRHRVDEVLGIYDKVCPSANRQVSVEV